MYAKTTIEEHNFLISAEEDFISLGKTEKRCPRCGNKIILEEEGSSYTVRCKTPNCINADFRGI